mgnify:FL=1
MEKFNLVHYPPWYLPVWRLRFSEAIWDNGVILAWGKKVYCKFTLDNSLIAHEKVHLKQQRFSYIYGLWWLVKYSFSARFRLLQEIPAHQAEYRLNPNDVVPQRLASSLYGNLITLRAARKLCRNI